MNGLQNAIEQSLSNLPVMALGKLLRRKLAEQSVEIDARTAESLARDLFAGKSNISLPAERTAPLQIVLSEKDASEIANRVQVFIEKDLEVLLLKTREDAAIRLLTTLTKRWPAESRKQRKEISEFRSRLYLRWKVGISKLRMLVTMARELGDNINRDARRNPDSPGAALVDVLTRLHARSCQVAEEVIVLLETGFANGALARWRTMHEIAVTAAFVSEHGTECAARYIDHQIVESYKGAQEYETLHVKLGYDPILAKEMKTIRMRYEHMIRKYGKTFAAQYGWAAKYLKGKQPTFKEIEKSAKIDHLRGHYRMASHGVHANPKGIFFSVTSIFPTELLLAGPSNSGLADPGDAAALSLLMISAFLLSLSPTFDHQVAIHTMSLLKDEIGTAFIQTDQQLHQDEERLRGVEAKGDKVPDVEEPQRRKKH